MRKFSKNKSLSTCGGKKMSLFFSGSVGLGENLLNTRNEKGIKKAENLLMDTKNKHRSFTTLNRSSFEKKKNTSLEHLGKRTFKKPDKNNNILQNN